MRILIIEDHHELADMMKAHLQQLGYLCDIAYTGNEGELMGYDNPYDAILLDLNLPDQDGLSILKSLRDQNIDTPVLIVTARMELTQRLRGFALGSDDYIVKPFEFEELHARIQAVIRRYHGRSNPIITIGPLILNPKTRIITLAEKVIDVSTKEFDIIEYLALRHPETVSIEELAEHLYDVDFNPFSSVIRVHIASIRKKLSMNNVHILKNRKGKGYYLCAE